MEHGTPCPYTPSGRLFDRDCFVVCHRRTPRNDGMKEDDCQSPLHTRLYLPLAKGRPRQSRGEGFSPSAAVDNIEVGEGQNGGARHAVPLQYLTSDYSIEIA
jgi:hypothetical protein